MAKTTEHKEGKALVKVIYFTSKTLSDGSHPFMVRITKDRIRKYIATGQNLLPKYWNDKHTGYREAIRKSYPEPDRNNLINALDGWERKYGDAAETLASSDEVHNANEVATKAVEGRKQARRSKLIAYIDELVADMKKSGLLGNMQIYQTVRNSLVEFIRRENAKETDVVFSAVTVKFCNDFEVHMRSRGNLETTMHNRFRTLRAVLNKAISEGVTSPTSYPFARTVSDKHKFSVSKFNTSTQKRAISRDDIRKVEAFVPSADHKGAYANVKNAAEIDRLQRAKDVFLFSFYVGGINFVDLVQLRWRNIGTDADGHKRLTYVYGREEENLAVNEMESVGEWILEHILGVTNAIPEHDESDESGKVTKSFFYWVASNNSVLFLLIPVVYTVDSTTYSVCSLVFSTCYTEVTSPPPWRS